MHSFYHLIIHLLLLSDCVPNIGSPPWIQQHNASSYTMLPNLEPSFQTGCHSFKVISTCIFSALIVVFFFFWTSSIIIHVIITSNEPWVVYETKSGTSVPSLDTQHFRSPSMYFGNLISILKHIIFFLLYFTSPFFLPHFQKWRSESGPAPPLWAPNSRRQLLTISIWYPLLLIAQFFRKSSVGSCLCTV